jgi:hypothetical protein
MELIPILATIILVATISTFILAIGAYILYKVRESRGQQVEVIQPSTVQAELFTPESELQEAQKGAAGQIIYEPQKVPSYKPSAEPIFVQQRAHPGPQPARYTPAPQQYVAQKQERSKQQPSADEKFMKYTSEGYVPVKDKDQGGLKWR